MEHVIELGPSRAAQSPDAFLRIVSLIRDQLHANYEYHEVRSRVRDDLESDFDKISRDCVRDNWDGYNAATVTREAIEEAKRFLRLLPISLVSPDIMPEPDGAVGFVWQVKERHVFTVGIKGDGMIYAAWYDGGPSKTGSFKEEISSDAKDLPKSIVDKIREFSE